MTEGGLWFFMSDKIVEKSVYIIFIQIQMNVIMTAIVFYLVAFIIFVLRVCISLKNGGFFLLR